MCIVVHMEFGAWNLETVWIESFLPGEGIQCDGWIFVETINLDALFGQTYLRISKETAVVKKDWDVGRVPLSLRGFVPPGSTQPYTDGSITWPESNPFAVPTQPPQHPLRELLSLRKAREAMVSIRADGYGSSEAQRSLSISYGP